MLFGSYLGLCRGYLGAILVLFGGYLGSYLGDLFGSYMGGYLGATGVCWSTCQNRRRALPRSDPPNRAESAWLQPFWTELSFLTALPKKNRQTGLESFWRSFSGWRQGRRPNDCALQQPASPLSMAIWNTVGAQELPIYTGIYMCVVYIRKYIHKI